MSAINWTCPHCNRPQTSISENRYLSFQGLYVGKNVLGQCGLLFKATACVNQECGELSITASLQTYEGNSSNPISKKTIDTFQLRPKGSAKPQPNFIPLAIRQDYQEACLIKDLSPKASATLARRCLQGMIRDFCKISKDRLNDEIKELNRHLSQNSAPQGVTQETVDAINAVRKIGNIGAHMETDIGVIIDIDPDEAQYLIQLIELLFEEWYIARKNREEKLNKIQEIANTKMAQKQTAPK